MELITYYINNKPHKIKAKILTNPIQKSIGLMFQKNPKPLLFTNNIQTYNPITSLFCKPFTAIWLDENFHATKITQVKKWKLHISGHGKHLLEIPISTKSTKTVNKIHQTKGVHSRGEYSTGLQKTLNKKSSSNKHKRGTKEV